MEIQVPGMIPSFFGRTLYDTERQAVFFNWTGAGFALRFSGTRLDMDAEAFADTFPGEADSYPFIAVLLDGQTQPAQVIHLEHGRQSYTLFSSAQPEEHTLRVFKRSENSKGRVCLYGLTLAGELLPYAPPRRKYKLEFVGDSITCGFGNEMDGDAQSFDPALENGLLAYPELASQLLNAEYQSICISGIPLCHASDPKYRPIPPNLPSPPPRFRSMETQYAYTDRNHQECMGMEDGFTPWDFSKYTPDAIIINLGTNDAFRLAVGGGGTGEELHFQRRYTAFLHELRRHNGPGPVIACTLGPMNYFLYDTIEKAVAAYQAETGDTRIFCLKYGAIDLWGEGYGGLLHPNVKTHQRMARELAQALRPWLEREA